MSSLFEFVPDIPGDKHAEILSRLDAIQREHDIRYIFAIESGSRAWGFPSPDSDFDVRFVYAHSRDWYLSIAPGRDVIETPIEGDWDINGWDIKKALGLLMKPNPVLLEWLSSPIRYLWDDKASSAIAEFAAKYVKPYECLNHYYHLAKRQWERNIEGAMEINLKKYFYVLRPALAIRWVRMNPDSLPPMNFQELVAGTDLSPPLEHQISELLIAKSRASEIGNGSRIAEIDNLIQQEFEWATEQVPKPANDTDAVVHAADTLFRNLIESE